MIFKVILVALIVSGGYIHAMELKAIPEGAGEEAIQTYVFLTQGPVPVKRQDGTIYWYKINEEKAKMPKSFQKKELILRLDPNCVKPLRSRKKRR